MPGIILIAYASGYGSAAIFGETIGQALSEIVFPKDILMMQKVEDIANIVRRLQEVLYRQVNGCLRLL